MLHKRNILFLILCLTLFILLKWAYHYSSTDQLHFLLNPTNKAVELLTNSTSFYKSDIGYWHEKSNIIINKSCSGGNFWIISFVMAVFTLLRYIKPISKKIFFASILLIITYLLTIFVNISRISIAIFLQPISLMHMSKAHADIIHQAEGTFVYLGFLILFYLLLDRVIKQKYVYEKPA